MSISSGPTSSSPIGAAAEVITVIVESLVDNALATEVTSSQRAVLLADAADSQETLGGLLIKVLVDAATAQIGLASTGTYLRTLFSEAEANESLRAALLGVVADEASATETFEAVLQHYEQLRDRVLATDTLATSMTASSLLFATALASDLVANSFSAYLTDTASAAAALLSTISALEILVDEAEAQVTLGDSLRVFGFLDDTANASDSLSSLAHLLGTLSSQASAAVVLTLGGEEYTAWVLNTENIAVTQYDNYAFNSYAELNQRYYGATTDGIYQLSGDTDAGAAIQAYLRAPLTDFGNASLKRTPEFYFGYTSDGELLFKAVVISPNGVKEEHWYKLEPRTADGLRETRTKPGKGLESVYWQYELHNINGADFQLDVVRIWPMVLTRRVR